MGVYFHLCLRSLVSRGSHQNSPGLRGAGHPPRCQENFPWTSAGKYSTLCHAGRHRRMKLLAAALSSLTTLNFYLKKLKLLVLV